MKRIYIAAMMLAFAGVANAQSISVDKVEEDGSRYTITTDSRISGLGDLGMKSTTVNGQTEYFINLTLSNNNVNKISKGRKLLLKLKNGEILSLENTIEIGAAENTTFTGTNTTFYNISPCYKVSEDQLAKITKGEVVKVRIDKNFGNRDVEIANNAFSSRVDACYKELKDAAKIKKTFTSDF